MARRRRKRGGRRTTSGIAPDELSLPLEEAEELGRVRDLGRLLQAIQEVLAGDAVLYVEGSSRHMASELREFLESNPAAQRRPIPKGTLWPKSAKFHLETSASNLDRLREIESRYPLPEVCDHLVVYRSDEVLLTAYDAGDGDVYASARLPKEDVEWIRRILAGPDEMQE